MPPLPFGNFTMPIPQPGTYSLLSQAPTGFDAIAGQVARIGVPGITGPSSPFPQTALSRFGSMGRGTVGDLFPYAKGAGALTNLSNIAKANAPAIAGQLAAYPINHLLGGQKNVEKTPWAEWLRGAGRGAGVGASIGSAIPIPGVGTGLGAAVGALAGGAADVLDVTKFFKGPSKTSKAEDSLNKFDKVLDQFTTGDSEVRDLIKQQVQVGLQLNLSLLDNPSDDEKKAAYLQAVSQGQELLKAYISSPVQFRIAAGFGNQNQGVQDSLALQATIAGYINPIADQIQQTGQQQASLYSDYAAAHPGDKTAALQFAGQSFANSSSNLANAYRMQAHLMPAAINRDMAQSQYGQQNQQQLAQSLSAQGASAYGYGDQSNVATDPLVDQYLAAQSGQ